MSEINGGWIPIIDGKCPSQAVGWERFTWEVNCNSGRSFIGEFDITGDEFWPSDVFIRKIPQPRISYDLATPANPPAHVQQHYFETLMASYEFKRAAIREAKTKKTIIPPIGMAEMMRISGLAMRD